MDKNNLLMFHRLSMDLFCIVNKRGDVVDINESFLKQLEWEKDDVIGQSILKFVSNQDHENLGAFYEKLVHNEEIEEFNCHLLKKSGEPQLYNSNCIFDKESENFYITSIISNHAPVIGDVQKMPASDLDRELFSEIQSIAKIGSWEYDIEKDEVSWSAQMYKLIGRDPKKGIPKLEELKEYVFKEDFEFWVKTLEKCLRDGEPYVMTYRIVNPFLGIVWLESRGRGFYDENSEKLTKIRGTTQDVTYLKLKEARLQVAIKEAQKLSKSKDLFLANMSHEIRTPLNGILGMTELLLGSAINAEQRDFLKIIKNSGQSLLEIINDILDLSKVESGLLKVNKREFVLEEMMNNLYHLFLNLAHAKGIELRFDIDKKISTDLIGDEMKLRQILTNLIGNALKFTLKGEVLVEAKLVDVHERHLFLRFSVKDSGVGIDQDQVGDQIFKPFVQESKKREENFGGTGLGLSISSQLAELMGGSLDYKSAVNAGAEFWFTLGFDMGSKKIKPSSGVKNYKSFTPDASDLKVLIVEDNSVNRLIISKFLERLGIFYDEATDGYDALEKLKGNTYDLIFMDLKMPKLSGFETTEKIKALKLKSEPKIVALTANAFEEDKSRCFELGMYDFLTKPVSFETVANLIGKVNDTRHI